MHAFPDPTDPVDSKDPEREAEINIRIGSTGPDFVGILFEDNGCGIPQEAIERIYEPFFTTKIGQGGTGLGLSIAHTLVSKKLGGIIQVESGPWGTRFNIEFPLMAPNRSESSI
jgi:signal transduction histidine kinase